MQKIFHLKIVLLVIEVYLLELAICLQEFTSCNIKRKKNPAKEKHFNYIESYAVFIGVKLTLGQMNSFCLHLSIYKIDV